MAENQNQDRAQMDEIKEKVAKKASLLLKEIPMDDEDFLKLSPRQLVEPQILEEFKKSLGDNPGPVMKKAVSYKKQLKDERDNYFMCTICMKVLDNPYECSKCQTAYCK